MADSDPRFARMMVCDLVVRDHIKYRADAAVGELVGKEMVRPGRYELTIRMRFANYEKTVERDSGSLVLIEVPRPTHTSSPE